MQCKIVETSLHPIAYIPMIYIIILSESENQLIIENKIKTNHRYAIFNVDLKIKIMLVENFLEQVPTLISLK